ncbi:L-seryl-tRNA(Sec) selenium transferase [Dethiosulfovibrio salsuginis]|uniref:L-seryl-tRNA(Sec) selenium transferase n=1 Tax=Dethiosulfovibrio salsuginis TaxID=561720 RepID=A0A1X7IAX3_9BACT|nr:L-seryl-tRNA(Sec) selenium transferase [Dethiosulfovibrio salsuginis]SMG11580.1 L-seryl-tRNA(Sec) selenium transferase [Dethiosulfovibrio salsuginis]
MSGKFNVLLREIPSMEKVLSDERCLRYGDLVERDVMKEICSSLLDGLRKAILSGELDSFRRDDFFVLLDESMDIYKRSSLRSVVNATGVVVHTNLGRSCLAEEAVDAVNQVARGYSTLEYDLKAGERGQRNSHVESLLCRVTGGEAAVVVNNNAGAVLLCLAALSSGRSAVVSRGELVEIGGSFRIPDIMTFSGTKLVEVGTTNRTHLKDYAGAIGDDTAMIMKVHPSNFKIVGFHKEVPREELAALAQEREVIFMEDLGSGVLADLSGSGLEGEITVRECLESGVDLVTFSGDKLLGGPQIGGIVGKRDLIERIRTYPLLRALRCDKMTLAAMEATLRLYLKGSSSKIPTVAMLTISSEDLKGRCENLACKLRSVMPDGSIDVVEVADAVGGGAYPGRDLPGWAVSLRVGSLSAGSLQEALRKRETPIVAGARDGALMIHGRTLLKGDDERVFDALSSIVKEDFI